MLSFALSAVLATATGAGHETGLQHYSTIEPVIRDHLP